MNSVVSNFEMGVGGWLGIIAGLYMMTKGCRHGFIIVSPFVCSFVYWGSSVIIRQSIFFSLSTLRSMCRYDAIACFLTVLFLSGTVFPTIHTIRMWTAPPAPPSPPPSEPPSEPSSEPSSTDTSTAEASSSSDSEESKEPESDESPIPSRRASNISDRVRVINEDGSDSPLSFEKVGSDDEGKKKN